jgi:hypothetical protein
MIAYFDCFSGVSGDMILGTLVDAGVPLETLRKELKRLPLRGYTLEMKKVKRAGISATKVNVHVQQKAANEACRKYKDIEKIFLDSRLSPSIQATGLTIFKRLFQAEAKVHGKRYTGIHLHELGAIDCIVDIVGALIGLEELGIKDVYASPLNLGSGTVITEHGLLPVPAPATVALLRDVPVYSSDLQFELTTPTGAALISSLAKGFGSLPEIKIKRTGTGAGGKDIKDRPNILRLFLGEHRGQDNEEDKVTVIETNIDDMNPQIYEHVVGKLFEAGALDVYLTQVIMKKGRPGIKLTVLCRSEEKGKYIDIIFSETTSIGLRYYRADRKTLVRNIKTVKTRYGKVNVKIAQLDRKKHKMSLEYEDCKKLAEKFGVPLREVLNTIK